MDFLMFERNRVGLYPKHIEIIKSFYWREDVERFMHEKQDVITVGN